MKIRLHFHVLHCCLVLSFGCILSVVIKKAEPNNLKLILNLYFVCVYVCIVCMYLGCIYISPFLK